MTVFTEFSKYILKTTTFLNVVCFTKKDTCFRMYLVFPDRKMSYLGKIPGEDTVIVLGDTNFNIWPRAGCYRLQHQQQQQQLWNTACVCSWTLVWTDETDFTEHFWMWSSYPDSSVQQWSSLSVSHQSTEIHHVHSMLTTWPRHNNHSVSALLLIHLWQTPVHEAGGAVVHIHK